MNFLVFHNYNSIYNNYNSQIYRFAMRELMCKKKAIKVVLFKRSEVH